MSTSLALCRRDLDRIHLHNRFDNMHELYRSTRAVILSTSMIRSKWYIVPFCIYFDKNDTSNLGRTNIR